MSLNVAVQMDPIDRINIAGDPTFAMLLEAQARGHTLAYYTTDRLAMRDGNVFATVEPLQVRDVKGDHFTLGAPERVALESVRRHPDAAGSAVRHELCHRHASPGARASRRRWW